MVALALAALPLRTALAQQTTVPFWFLLPPATGSGGATLGTHTADIDLWLTGESVSAEVDAVYRVRNPGRSPLTLTLRIVPRTGDATAGAEEVPALPGDFALTAAGSVVAPTPADGGYTVAVTVPADGRTDVALRYTLDLGRSPLARVAYAVNALSAWGAGASTRVSVIPPDTSPPQSWVELKPDDWRYAPSSGETVVVRWLFEGTLPAEPVAFEWIHPLTWQQMEQARAGAQPAGAVRLGELYTSLAEAAQEGADAERFRSQAVAAFTAAEQASAGNAAAPERIAALLGLSSLYRRSMVDEAGTASPAHGQLLVASVAEALKAMPGDHPRRSEALQWLNEGLDMLLGDARARRDWELALGVLDQLSALPLGLVDPELINRERRLVIFEQSLQMLEEGQREEAVAVAGGGITDAGLRPPDAARALFAAWQVTMTVSPGGSALEFLGVPSAGVEEAAFAAAEELAARLREADPSATAEVMRTQAPGGSGAAPLLAITLPARAGGMALANATPLGPQWALLRTLLAQVAPAVAEEAGATRRSVTVSQPVNLQPVRNEWRETAAGLETQAAQFDAQSTPADRSDPAALEAALRARVQAANYRAEARAWAALAENSRVVALLRGPGDRPGEARAWQIAFDAPAQTLEFSALSANWGGLLLAGGLILLAVILITGVLWVLL